MTDTYNTFEERFEAEVDRWAQKQIEDYKGLIPEPVDVPKKVQENTSQGKPAEDKTLGNAPPEVENEKKVLEAVKKLDNNQSGVFSNSVDLMKQIRDLDRMVSQSGVFQMASQALGTALAQSGMNMPSNINDSSDLAAAIEEANRRIETIQAMETLMELIRQASQNIINSPRDYTEELKKTEKAFALAADLNKIGLPQTTVEIILYTITQFLSATEFAWSYIMTGYPWTDHVQSLATLAEGLDFRGMDRNSLAPAVNVAADRLALSLIDGATEELMDTAAILREMVAEDPEAGWDDVDDIIREGIARILQLLSSSQTLTVTQLETILAILMDLLGASGRQKTFGSGGNLLGMAAQLIPQVGNMVRGSMQQFLPKSVNDTKKIQESLEKFTRSQALAEKKRAVAQTKLVRNKKPSNNTSELSTKYRAYVEGTA